jgi:hypothetical protein
MSPKEQTSFQAQKTFSQNFYFFKILFLIFMLAVYLQQNFRFGNWEENTATETTSFLSIHVNSLFNLDIQNDINHVFIKTDQDLSKVGTNT